MNQFLKYLGAFCLLTIAASLAFCSVGVYNGMQTLNRVFAGADNYTCRQFHYDMTDPQADKLPAIAVATILYGAGEDAATAEEAETRQQEIFEKGTETAVAKVAALCASKPDERLLNLFAQSLVSPTVAGVSSSSVTSPTTSVQ